MAINKGNTGKKYTPKELRVNTEDIRYKWVYEGKTFISIAHDYGVSKTVQSETYHAIKATIESNIAEWNQERNAFRQDERKEIARIVAPKLAHAVQLIVDNSVKVVMKSTQHLDEYLAPSFEDGIKANTNAINLIKESNKQIMDLVKILEVVTPAVEEVSVSNDASFTLNVMPLEPLDEVEGG